MAALNPHTLGASRSLGIRQHLTRYAISRGKLNLCYSITEDMVSDVLTKRLERKKLARFALIFFNNLRTDWDLEPDYLAPMFDQSWYPDLVFETYGQPPGFGDDDMSLHPVNTSDKAFQILVTMLSGRTITVTVDPTHTIATVKSKIVTFQDPPMDIKDIRLVCGGIPLEDNEKTLSQYAIQKRSKITVLSRLRGGSPEHTNSPNLELDSSSSEGDYDDMPNLVVNSDSDDEDQPDYDGFTQLDPDSDYDHYNDLCSQAARTAFMASQLSPFQCRHIWLLLRQHRAMLRFSQEVNPVLNLAQYTWKFIYMPPNDFSRWTALGFMPPNAVEVFHLLEQYEYKTGWWTASFHQRVVIFEDYASNPSTPSQVLSPLNVIISQAIMSLPTDDYYFEELDNMLYEGCEPREDRELAIRLQGPFESPGSYSRRVFPPGNATPAQLEAAFPPWPRDTPEWLAYVAEHGPNSYNNYFGISTSPAVPESPTPSMPTTHWETCAIIPALGPGGSNAGSDYTLEEQQALNEPDMFHWAPGHIAVESEWREARRREADELERVGAFNRLRCPGGVMNVRETELLLQELDPEYQFPINRPNLPSRIQNMLNNPSSPVQGSSSVPSWVIHGQSAVDGWDPDISVPDLTATEMVNSQTHLTVHEIQVRVMEPVIAAPAPPPLQAMDPVLSQELQEMEDDLNGFDFNEDMEQAENTNVFNPAGPE